MHFALLPPGLADRYLVCNRPFKTGSKGRLPLTNQRSEIDSQPTGSGVLPAIGGPVFAPDALRRFVRGYARDFSRCIRSLSIQSCSIPFLSSLLISCDDRITMSRVRLIASHTPIASWTYCHRFPLQCVAHAFHSIADHASGKSWACCG